MLGNKMDYLVKELDGSLHLGPLDNHILAYLIPLGDSLKKIEQLEGYNKEGVLGQRVKVKSELALANTFAKHLEGIFNTAGMEIPEEYTKKYEFLKARLIFFNCLYNPLSTTSK